MTHRSKFMGLLALSALTLALPEAALAHAQGHTGEDAGFLAGFLHPILGWDHVAAMVAVGLWGAFLRAPAIWLLPVIFPLVMAFGALIGILGFTLPLVETGIALSGVVLGLMILTKAKPALWIAGLLVGFFAIFHGYAHGVELPDSAHAYAFIIGFVIATGLLHVAGIAFGTLTRWPAGTIAVQSTGAVIAGVGTLFLFNLA